MSVGWFELSKFFLSTSWVGLNSSIQYIYIYIFFFVNKIYLLENMSKSILLIRQKTQQENFYTYYNQNNFTLNAFL